MIFKLGRARNLNGISSNNGVAVMALVGDHINKFSVNCPQGILFEMGKILDADEVIALPNKFFVIKDNKFDIKISL